MTDLRNHEYDCILCTGAGELIAYLDNEASFKLSAGGIWVFVEPENVTSGMFFNFEEHTHLDVGGVRIIIQPGWYLFVE